MRRTILTIACALVMASAPARAELLQVDLSIFGMD